MWNSISKSSPSVELKKTVSQLLDRTKLDGVSGTPPTELTVTESEIINVISTKCGLVKGRYVVVT